MSFLTAVRESDFYFEVAKHSLTLPIWLRPTMLIKKHRHREHSDFMVNQTIHGVKSHVRWEGVLGGKPKHKPTKDEPQVQ